MAKDPGSYVEPGFFMTFSIMDFAPPRHPSEPDAEMTAVEICPARTPVQPVSVEPGPPVPASPSPNRAERFIRRKEYMDHEYPEWMDDLPPWRNPDPGGDTYLYVWQQHQARIRGHH